MSHQNTEQDMTLHINTALRAFVKDLLVHTAIFAVSLVGAVLGTIGFVGGGNTTFSAISAICSYPMLAVTAYSIVALVAPVLRSRPSADTNESVDSSALPST